MLEALVPFHVGLPGAGGITEASCRHRIDRQTQRFIVMISFQEKCATTDVFKFFSIMNEGNMAIGVLYTGWLIYMD